MTDQPTEPNGLLPDDPAEDYAGDTADEVVGPDDVEALPEVPD